jgi:hypothetical protein
LSENTAHLDGQVRAGVDAMITTPSPIMGMARACRVLGAFIGCVALCRHSAVLGYISLMIACSACSMVKKYLTCIAQPNRTSNRLPMLRWSYLLLRDTMQRVYLGIATRIPRGGYLKGKVAALDRLRVSEPAEAERIS